MNTKPSKARRGRGEGSVAFRQDKGLWFARISLGYGANGSRVRKTVYGKTKREVAERLRGLQTEHDTGRLIKTEQLTTGEYLTRWLHNTAKNNVGVQTWERYRQLVEIYLVPILDGVQLSKLSPLHVEQCYATMGRGFSGRKPAGATTRKFAGVILSTALKHAVRTKTMSHNPASDVAKARPAEREMRYLSQTNAREFLIAARGHGLETLFVAAIGTGARQGELHGLQWSDLDFEKGTIEVKRTLAWVKKEPILKEPKSKAGRRSITLPGFVITALRFHKQAALKTGHLTAPVFCTRTGNYLDKKNVLRAFRGVVRKVNKDAATRSDRLGAEQSLIPNDIRFHDLRHTHASHLIAAGHSIKAVSRRLGHSGIEITLRVYSHLMPNDDEKLAAGTEVIFG